MAGLSQKQKRDAGLKKPMLDPLGNILRVHEAGAYCGDSVPRVTSFLRKISAT